MIRNLPLNWFRHKYRRFRSAFFTVPRPEGKYLRTLGTEETIIRALGKQSYAPNWEFSYEKKGETLNLSRVVWAQMDVNERIRWWQYHVRGWPVEKQYGSMDLRCHFEPEPTEHPYAHLDEIGFNVAYGMDQLADDLARAGVPFEEVTWDGS